MTTLWLVFAGSTYYPNSGMQDCQLCTPYEHRANARYDVLDNDWKMLYRLNADGNYFLERSYYG